MSFLAGISLDEQNDVSQNWTPSVNICDFSAKHGRLELSRSAKAQGCLNVFRVRHHEDYGESARRPYGISS